METGFTQGGTVFREGVSYLRVTTAATSPRRNPDRVTVFKACVAVFTEGVAVSREGVGMSPAPKATAAHERCKV